MAELFVMEAEGIRVAFDPENGQIALLEVEREGRRFAPFARVPWADHPIDSERFPKNMPPHLKAMSGDFFCAPFCADDMEEAPLHGWTANSPWKWVETKPLADGSMARFRLGKKIAGAVVEKVLVVRNGHPFLYQRHEFKGGAGAIPVAHHAMVDLRTGGYLRFSPKLRAESPAKPPEPGRSVLQYPAQGTDLAAFPGPDGPINLLRYPIGQWHEDFVMLIDDPAVAVGWATATRPAYGDVAILLKSAFRLPQTMLWFSNGGRDHAPWCGQHVGVLGIEDACSFGANGWAASIDPNPLTEEGIPTAIDLGEARVVSVSVAIGALPTSAAKGIDLRLSADNVVLADGRREPFDAGWLG